jgi:phosphoribosylglycinamide formyltransferase 1
MSRLAVLASGAGTNLEAIQHAIEAGRLSARIAIVLCDRPGAGALGRARAHGLHAVLVERRAFADRDGHERALVDEVRRAGGADLTVLAGYLRIAGPVLREALWPMINLHPALLPGFPGLNAVEEALAAGVKVTGCTVHFVDEGVDSGPIIAQRAVPVREGDDAKRLRARIHRAEHRLLPEVIGLMAAGQVRLEGRRVRILSAEAARAADTSKAEV